MKLSIIMPAYNESANIEDIVQKVVDVKLPDGFEKELIIVNDCSKDATLEKATYLSKKFDFIQVLDNKRNLGKSQTVRKGIIASTGDWVVIQDADLEYEPEDFAFMLERVLKFNCDVAYGNRFGMDNGMVYLKNFYGNLLLSFFSNLFTIGRIKVNIPDMEVCYKLIRGDVARRLADNITSSSNFGFEPEITAKLSRYLNAEGKHLKFMVLPIRYYPRTYEQGKKMKAFKDGFKALVEILKFNIF